VNIENYISSGIIESYVLDQLSGQERTEVQQLSEKHPEIRKAIIETEETLLAFGKKARITPPASVKNRLFLDLGLPLNERNEASTQEVEQTKFDEPEQITEPQENSKQPQRKSILLQPYFSAAASIIAILGIVLAVYYRGQWLDTREKFSELISQNQTLAQQYNIVKNQSDQYAYNLNILRQPGIENVAMAGLDMAPDAEATVHWNKSTNEVFLNAKKMPSNDLKNHYQLWAIVDGKPVDMGVFDVAGDMTSLLKMKNINNASAFAVTLEPRGGSKNPTMEKMLVIGQI
jgi:anti-sigma-K factor RskA